MFLSFEKPGGDKGASIFARDLSSDEGFNPSEISYLPWDSDRSRANRAIIATNLDLGKKPGFKAFGMLFNQFTWEGTTGWEYWSDDYSLMLTHALLVAAALKVPLHLHLSLTDDVFSVAGGAGIDFDFRTAKLVEKPSDSNFIFTNKQIALGEYFELIEVKLPAGLPLPSEL